MSEVPLQADNTEAVAPLGGVATLEKQTFALSTLLATRAFSHFVDRLLRVMGYICGVELLLLGMFITYQVIARKLNIIQALATDVMSGYVLAMAATWATAYALRTGSHVRIDVLLPFMPPKVRWVADWVALGAVAFFGGVTAWKMWEAIIVNYQRGTVTNDYPLTPIWIPKLVVGIGFSLLTFIAIEMMVRMVAEGILPRLHRRMGGGEVASEAVITHGTTSVT